jgi:hypothetical protein
VRGLLILSLQEVPELSHRLPLITSARGCSRESMTCTLSSFVGTSRPRPSWTTQRTPTCSRQIIVIIERDMRYAEVEKPNKGGDVVWERRCPNMLEDYQMR